MVLCARVLRRGRFGCQETNSRDRRSYTLDFTVLLFVIYYFLAYILLYRSFISVFHSAFFLYLFISPHCILYYINYYIYYFTNSYFILFVFLAEFFKSEMMTMMLMTRPTLSYSYSLKLTKNTKIVSFLFFLLENTSF